MKLFSYYVVILTLAFILAMVSSCTEIPKEPPKPEPKAKVTRKICRVKPVVIVVIDTGMGWRGLGKESHLCKYGHKNLTDTKTAEGFDTVDPVPLDEHGHGTNIVGIIDNELKDSGIPYCIVVIKYYTTESSGMDNLSHTIAAINHARLINADYINYSGGGIMKSEPEKEAILKFLDQGGKFIAAAGNEGINIDFFHFYPASYDPRIIVVGNKNKDGSNARTSDYGKSVNRWEIGEKVVGNGVLLSGTSQATAVATGKIVFANETQCDINKEIEQTAQLSY